MRGDYQRYPQHPPVNRTSGQSCRDERRMPRQPPPHTDAHAYGRGSRFHGQRQQNGNWPPRNYRTYGGRREDVPRSSAPSCDRRDRQLPQQHKRRAPQWVSRATTLPQRRQATHDPELTRRNNKNNHHPLQQRQPRVGHAQPTHQVTMRTLTLKSASSIMLLNVLTICKTLRQQKPHQ